MTLTLNQRLQEVHHIFLWSHSKLNQIRKRTMQKGFFRQNMRIFLNHFRDCRQITFVTLNRFRSLSISPSLTPCSSGKILSWMKYQAKLNKKYMPTGSILFQVLKLLLIKRYSYQFFISICFCINTIWKKIFVTNFYFF